MAKMKDITGQRFGKLAAIAPTNRRADKGSVVWHCRCDCGNEIDVPSNRLKQGKIRSCGCLSNPAPRNYVGQTFGRLTVLEYAGRKRKHTPHSAATITYWRCRCICGKEAVVAQPELLNGDTRSCGCLQQERARDSLALVDGTSVTILERTKNRLRSSNTSGHTGVCQMKDGKWQAYINFKKKRYYLGRYKRLEDAVKARERGEEMHEEFLAEYYSQAHRAENRPDEPQKETAPRKS